LGAAFFVTPVGFAPFVVLEVAFLFVVFGLAVRFTAGAVSTTGSTRGLELPVCERVPSRAISVPAMLDGLVPDVSAAAQCHDEKRDVRC
jgi:hypothetical protein